MLAQLEHDITRAGLTLDGYLKQSGKTKDDIKKISFNSDTFYREATDEEVENHKKSVKKYDEEDKKAKATKKQNNQKAKNDTDGDK